MTWYAVVLEKKYKMSHHSKETRMVILNFYSIRKITILLQDHQGNVSGKSSDIFESDSEEKDQNVKLKHTNGHINECRTFLDQKNSLEPLVNKNLL
jgi:hypothetical protein